MTPRFLDPLRIERVDGDHSRARWRLLSALRYDSAIVGLVEVPEGFVTDMASVPRLPLAFWLTGDTAHRAAVVHDWLYQCQCTERATADAVLAEAMAADGEPSWRRRLMWAAVRLGGWWAWRSKDDRVEALNPEHPELS